MKKFGKPWFFILVLLIVACSCLGIIGVYSTYGDVTSTYFKGLSDFRWGLDIGGGIDAVLVQADEAEVTDSDIDTAVDILETRMAYSGLSGNVFADRDAHSVLLRFSWGQEVDYIEIESLLHELAVRGDFGIYDSDETDTDGLPTGELKVDNTGLNAAYAMFDQNTGAPVLVLDFNESGLEAFTAMAEELDGDNFSIWLDGELIGAPAMNGEVESNQVIISDDGFSIDQVVTYANKITSGKLPFAMELQHYGATTPTLGENAKTVLSLTVLALFVAVCVVMILRYKASGLAAVIALFAQAMGLVAIATGYFYFVASKTVTLPLLLAMVVLFVLGVFSAAAVCERIRRELGEGRPPRVAVVAAFDSAVLPNLDGSVLTALTGFAMITVFGPVTNPFASLARPLLEMIGVSTSSTLFNAGLLIIAAAVLHAVIHLLVYRILAVSMLEFPGLATPEKLGGARDA